MGFVVGLGVASAKEAGIAEPTLESSGILDNINIISSVSGGSWFAAELIYSARFKQLVDQMLAEPSRIRELFQAEWVAPYMEFLKSTHNILQDLLEVGSFSGSDVTQISTTAGILGRALDERRSWSDVIIYFLQLTASISPALTLSDQANSWAQNKTWLACNSLAVPPQEAPAWPFVSHPFGTNNYRYWGNSGGAEPEVAVIPSKISWRIGGTQSPFPFVASGALGPKTTLAWEGTTRDFFKSHWISNTAPLDFGALEQGNLPVSLVAASSSAVIGGTILSPTGDLPTAVAELRLKLAVSATLSATPGTNALANGQDVIDRIYETNSADGSTTEALAQSGMVSLMDGCYTDNTAIGHAVGAGASQVLSLQQGGLENFWQLFSENSANPYLFQGALTAAFFGIFTFPASELGGDTPVAHAKKLVEAFPKLHLPNSTYISLFQVGQMTVVTRDNSFFGIEGGRTIEVLVVNVNPVFQGLANHVPILNSWDSPVVAAVADAVIGILTDPANAYASSSIAEFLKIRG